MGEFYQDNYWKAKQDSTMQDPLLPRLWPYVLVGIVVAMLLLASFEPIPHQLTNAERIWFCQSDLHC